MSSRKDLVAAYRQRKVPMGVFQVVDTSTGNRYYDAGPDMGALWNRHRFQLDFGNHPNAGLQAAWRASGEASFVFSVVAELTYDTDGPHDVRTDLQALLGLCLEEGKDAGARRL